MAKKPHKHNPDHGGDNPTGGAAPWSKIAGPHQIPQEHRTQAAVSGPPLYLGSTRSVLLIRDNTTHRWAVYPGADPREAFWVPADEMVRLACRVLVAETARMGVHLDPTSDPSPTDSITPEDLS